MKTKMRKTNRIEVNRELACIYQKIDQEFSRRQKWNPYPLLSKTNAGESQPVAVVAAWQQLAGRGTMWWVHIDCVLLALRCTTNLPLLM